MLGELLDMIKPKRNVYVGYPRYFEIIWLLKYTSKIKIISLLRKKNVGKHVQVEHLGKKITNTVFKNHHCYYKKCTDFETLSI